MRQRGGIGQSQPRRSSKGGGCDLGSWRRNRQRARHRSSAAASWQSGGGGISGGGISGARRVGAAHRS